MCPRDFKRRKIKRDVKLPVDKIMKNDMLMVLAKINDFLIASIC